MAVENTTNIAGLDDTLPTGTDTKSEGDNHLRLLKTVLKHVFAGFPGEVLLAAAEAQGATVNDYVLTVAPAPAAYAANTVVVFRANHANTGAATLKVGALAAKSLLNPEGTALRTNAITATTWVLAIYDGTNFRMIGGGNSQAIYDYANQLAFQAALPLQTGNAGRYLRTDGSDASWSDALPVYTSGGLPSADIGDIQVTGAGLHRFKYGRYAPDSLPLRHRAGGTLTFSGTSVTVGAGSWRGVANDVDLVLAASLTKVLQASGAWAAGPGANGLFAGALAVSTWYHVFAIRNDATGAVDVGFDTSATAANRPAGWTAYRRMGSVFNRSDGTILPFVQNGSRFRFMAPFTSLSGVAVTATVTPVVLAAPIGVRTLATLNVSLGGQTAPTGVYIFTPGSDNISAAQAATVRGDTGGYAGVQVFDVVTDTSSQVSYRSVINAAAGGFFLSTIAYVDFIED